MSFIDFTELKEKVSIEDVISMLGLEMRESGEQLRCACPACEGSDRSLVVTPSKQVFYCHEDKKGGDLISLVAHIRMCGMKDAAQFITDRLCPVADRPPEKVETGKFQPLSYLEYDHEAIAALGFEVETATRLGIGYAKKGIMRGKIAIPIRLSDGSLVGYIGITEAKLPPRWQLP